MSVGDGEIVTVAEAATIARKAKTCIHGWTISGFRGRVLPCTRFGASKAIKVSDLAEFLAYYRSVKDGRKSRRSGDAVG